MLTMYLGWTKWLKIHGGGKSTGPIFDGSHGSQEKNWWIFHGFGYVRLPGTGVDDARGWEGSCWRSSRGIRDFVIHPCGWVRTCSHLANQISEDRLCRVGVGFNSFFLGSRLVPGLVAFRIRKWLRIVKNRGSYKYICTIQYIYIHKLSMCWSSSSAENFPNHNRSRVVETSSFKTHHPPSTAGCPIRWNQWVTSSGRPWRCKTKGTFASRFCKIQKKNSNKTPW